MIFFDVLARLPPAGYTCMLLLCRPSQILKRKPALRRHYSLPFGNNQPYP